MRGIGQSCMYRRHVAQEVEAIKLQRIHNGFSVAKGRLVRVLRLGSSRQAEATRVPDHDCVFVREGKPRRNPSAAGSAILFGSKLIVDREAHESAHNQHGWTAANDAVRDVGAVGRARVTNPRFHQLPSAARTANTRCGSAIPLRACSPRSSKVTSVEARARSRTVLDTRISFGAVRPEMRDAKLTAMPCTLPASRSTSPAWMPRCSASPIFV